MADGAKRGTEKKVRGKTEEPDWYDVIVTKGNLVWAGLMMVLLIVWLVLMYQTMNLKTEHDNQVTFNQDWEMQLDAVKTKESQTLYLPSAKVMKITPEQEHGIYWLHDFFDKITTFDDTTTYTIGYQYAKAHVQDDTLYREFLPKPADRGEDDNSQTRTEWRNLKTQTLVTGPNTYLVGVTYQTRKLDSSFNAHHQRAAKTVTKWFTCQGQKQIWNKVELAKDIKLVR